MTIPHWADYGACTIDEIDLTEDASNWLIFGLIPTGATLIHGASGIGKTFLGIVLGRTISDGIPLDIFHPIEANVVDLTAPASDEEHYYRPVAVASVEDTKEQLAARVLVTTANQVPPNFFVLRESGDIRLDDPEHQMRIRNMVKKGHHSLLIFDTARGMMDGDENDSTDVRKIIRFLLELWHEHGCSTIVNHHVTESNKTKARGSGDWKAGPTCVLHAEDLQFDGRGKMDFGLRITKDKARHVPYPLEWELRLHWHENTKSLEPEIYMDRDNWLMYGQMRERAGLHQLREMYGPTAEEEEFLDDYDDDVPF